MKRNVRSYSHFRRVWAPVALIGAAAIFGAGGQANSQELDLSEMSIEELMNIPVTSVSKKEEQRMGAAAALFVINSEDIRRSGATSIPELLRSVPGLNVARVATSRWAISARGFNDAFANKLLVLVDGRSVYTPLFAGTWWEIQDTMLEDIERIEVIRGPGAALWGANAVNGVINIITKSAQDTVGGLLTVGGGTEEEGFASLRYGFEISEGSYFRVYSKYFSRDGARFANERDAGDDYQQKRLGFRWDREFKGGDRLTLIGDYFELDYWQTYDVPTTLPPFNIRKNVQGDMDGANVLVRWTHPISDESEIQLKFYWDVTDRVDVTFDERRHTLDVDFMHRFQAGDRHEMVWGLGYRFTTDQLHNTFSISHFPESRSNRLYSAFIQDEITLIEDTLTLIVGSKFEYNDYSGFEVQPSIRMAYIPKEGHTLWGAISRAVRTPSRAEHEIQLKNISLPFFLVGVEGNSKFDSESVLAYEFGYRALLRENLMLDIAAFYNDYRDLRSVELQLPRFELGPGLPHFFLPAKAANNLDAETYGVEIALDYSPLDWWKLRASYTYLEVHTHLNPSTIDILSEGLSTSSPEQQFRIESHMDIPHNIELDLTLHYVDKLPPFGLPAVGVGDYLDFDIRLAWQPREDLSLEVVGQNLLDSQRDEFVRTFVTFVPTEVERGVYGKLTWRF